MKRFILIFAMLFLAILVNAQEGKSSNNDEINTIFGKSEETKIGWFVGIDPGYTQFDGRDVWLAGIGGGMIINHNLTIGLTGHGWTNRNGMFYPEVTDTVGAYLEGGYGGLLLEYTLFPKSPVHVTFPIMIGGGGASYVTDMEYPEWDEDEWDTSHKTLDTDHFFTIEPGVRAEVNILKFMRFNAGVSYRYVGGLHLINTSSDMMNGFTATAGLKFGKF